MRHTGPKVKLSRRLGLAVTPKAQKYLKDRPFPPGQHGQARRRRLSNYGKQLLEKQRLRAQYSVSESHLRKLFALASASKGRTGERLVQLLEMRLDALVLRTGIARSIDQARQFVSHGHIEVNEKRLNIPSARLRPGDRFAVQESSRRLPAFNDRSAVTVPPYLEVAQDGYGATLRYVPERGEIPVICQEQLVVEFYSR